MAAAKNDAGERIVISKVETRSLTVALIGTSPIILNRMSQKALHELLLPAGRKNAAEKASSLKHDPVQEFQASPYVLSDPEAKTALAVMASSVKGAMMTAALDLPGTKKAQIGRLVYVENDLLPLWGTPKIFLSVVRSADMNRTPDVRTRAIVPRWASLVEVRFVTPILNETAILNLLAAGGTISGIGDWRPEKGKGAFGQFRVANVTDPEFQSIVQDAGRAAQLEALENPVAYDDESADLLSWFEVEVKVRGKTRSTSKAENNGVADLVPA